MIDLRNTSPDNVNLLIIGAVEKTFPLIIVSFILIVIVVSFLRSTQIMVEGPLLDYLEHR